VVEFSSMYIGRVGYNWRNTILHVSHMGLKKVVLLGEWPMSQNIIDKPINMVPSKKTK
jgi:hypothetical protein